MRLLSPPQGFNFDTIYGMIFLIFLPPCLIYLATSDISETLVTFPPKKENSGLLVKKLIT